jgi:hypothetical protein
VNAYLLTTHRRGLQHDIIDHTISEVRKHAGSLVEREMDRLIKTTRHEADVLVRSSLDRTNQKAEELVERIAATATKQQEQARENVRLATASIQRELRPVLLWVAVIVGLTNLAGILAAVMFVKH